jgi:uncharacterized protein
MNDDWLPPGVRRFSIDALSAEPWRNGGGSTRTIASSIAQSGEEWLWRVSLADIGRNGPFSRFPGIDRHLTLVEGRGLVLSDASSVMKLHGCGESVVFPGERALEATLLERPARALNVMSRRGRAVACVKTITPSAGVNLEMPGAHVVVLVLAGSNAISAVSAGFELDLREGEGLWCRPSAMPFQLRAATDDDIAVVAHIVET